MAENTGTGPSYPYASLSGIARILIIVMIIGVPLGVLSRFFDPLEIPSYLAIGTQVILFLIWFYRAHRNLPALAATELAFTHAWAIIWWFIPILNFWKPYQVTVEIVKSSDPSVGRTDASIRSALPLPHLVIIRWMYVFIGGAIAIGIAFGGGPLEFRATVSGINDVITTFLGIFLILEITKRQTKKIALIHSGGYGSF